jgi:hypothetical protein
MVSSLSEQISVVAAQSRSEVSSALGRLLEIREVVRTRPSRSPSWSRRPSQIDRFVETITGSRGRRTCWR